MHNSKQWMPCALFLCWTSGIPPLSTVLVSASLRNVFTGPRSFRSAHGFPWCLSSFGQEFLYFGPLCHRAMQTSSEIIQTIILSHLSIKDCDTFIMTPRSRHPAKASTTNSNKQNYHHRGCPGESWACVRVRLHICMCVYMCVCHTCWVGPLDYPDKSH